MFIGGYCLLSSEFKVTGYVICVTRKALDFLKKRCYVVYSLLSIKKEKHHERTVAIPNL